MGARKYDLVKINAEAVKKDLLRFGLDMKALSRKMGKDDAFISSYPRKEHATRDIVKEIENALFAEPGAYTIEITEEPEKPAEPKMTEGMGILLKQTLSAVGGIGATVDETKAEVTKAIYRIDGLKAGNDRKMDELIKAVKESNAANEVILRDILQKEKEICTLAAKLLSAIERRANL